MSKAASIIGLLPKLSQLRKTKDPNDPLNDKKKPPVVVINEEDTTLPNIHKKKPLQKFNGDGVLKLDYAVSQILAKDPIKRTDADAVQLRKALDPLLKGNDFLRALPQTMRNGMARMYRQVNLPKDEVIFMQGDRGNLFYIILSGNVRILVEENSSNNNLKSSQQSGQVTFETRFQSALAALQAEGDSEGALYIPSRRGSAEGGRRRSRLPSVIGATGQPVHQQGPPGGRRISKPTREQRMNRSSVHGDSNQVMAEFRKEMFKHTKPGSIVSGKESGVSDGESDGEKGKGHSMAFKKMSNILSAVKEDKEADGGGAPSAATTSRLAHLKKVAVRASAKAGKQLSVDDGETVQKAATGMARDAVERFRDVRRSSSFKVQKKEVTGMQVGVLKSSQSFGELALKSDAPRKASAITGSPCTLLIIQKADYLVLLKEASQEEADAELQMLKLLTTFKSLVEVPNSTLKELAPIVQTEVYVQGQALAIDKQNKIIFVVKGKVQICNLRPDVRSKLAQKQLQADPVEDGDVGEEMFKDFKEGQHYEVLGTVLAGDHFGESCIFSEFRHGFYSKALSTCEVVWIAGAQFNDYVPAEGAEHLRRLSMERLKKYARDCVWTEWVDTAQENGTDLGVLR